MRRARSGSGQECQHIDAINSVDAIEQFFFNFCNQFFWGNPNRPNCSPWSPIYPRKPCSNIFEYGQVSFLPPGNCDRRLTGASQTLPALFQVTSEGFIHPFCQHSDHIPAQFKTSFSLTRGTQNISEYIQNIFVFSHMNTIQYNYDTASAR